MKINPRPSFSLLAALLVLGAGGAGTALADGGDDGGGTAIYSVPAGIPSDCSVAVEGALNDWLAGVPDGSTVVFPANRCYGIDNGLVVADRNN